MTEIPPAGTPVSQKLYNEACQRIAELEKEAVEVLELHESTVAHVGRLEAANTELATTNSLLTQEVAMLRKAYE